MSLPTVNGVGTLTADPELRFTPGGQAVATVNIAFNNRYKKDGEWVDGDTTFLRGQVWKDYAENVAESLVKGSQVLVQGALKQRSFETREGEKRTVLELDIWEIGPSLRFATAKVNKQSKGGSRASSSDDSAGGGW